MTTTPLGNAVEPEVNCRKAISSSLKSAASGSAAAGSACSSSEVMTFSIEGICPTADQRTFPTRALVTSARGRATLRMVTSASMKASSLPSESGG